LDRFNVFSNQLDWIDIRIAEHTTRIREGLRLVLLLLLLLLLTSRQSAPRIGPQLQDMTDPRFWGLEQSM
jgi:hypothetical protein